MPAERVVYILGAGFSAPLGLPVVSNFLEKARDRFYLHGERLPHFERVFEEVKRLANIKHDFVANLADIEELLSILDMQALCKENPLEDDFKKFVCDVIKQHTPQFERTDHPLLMFKDNEWGGYNAFAAGVCNLIVGTKVGPAAQEACQRLPDVTTRYDIVSLNYDCVLEEACKHINDRFGTQNAGFARSFPSNDSEKPTLAKLHGSVDSGLIVPPTWRKLVSNEMVKQWGAASEVLSKANHIRILGYSLPTTDAYVRYLLKASASEAPHLKTIHIITRNGGGEDRRYREFISTPKMRFVSAEMGDYLTHVCRARKSAKVEASAIGVWSGVRFNLESAHQAFMEEHK